MIMQCPERRLAEKQGTEISRTITYPARRWKVRWSATVRRCAGPPQSGSSIRVETSRMFLKLTDVYSQLNVRIPTLCVAFSLQLEVFLDCETIPLLSNAIEFWRVGLFSTSDDEISDTCLVCPNDSWTSYLCVDCQRRIAT